MRAETRFRKLLVLSIRAALVLWTFDGLAHARSPIVPPALSAPLAESGCGGAIEKLRQLHFVYGHRARDARRRPKRYRESLAEITTFIRTAATLPCASEILNEHAILSYFDLTNESRDIEYFSDSKVAANRGRARVLSLLREMAVSGRLVPIDASIRAALAIDSDSDWRTVGTAKRYAPAILAGYDCWNGKIYFDPLVAPLDLGGAIAHELDHLFRDKGAFGALSFRWGSVSPTELRVLDEAAGVLMGALSQLRLYRDRNRDYSFQDRRRNYSLDFRHALPRNANFERLGIPAGYDLTLFRKEGVLDSLWQENFDRSAALWTLGERRDFRRTEREFDRAKRLEGNRDLRPFYSSGTDADASRIRFPEPYAAFGDIFKIVIDPAFRNDLARLIRTIGADYYPDLAFDENRVASALVDGASSPDADNALSPLRVLLSAGDSESVPRANIDFEHPSLFCRSAADRIRNDRGGVRPTRVVSACRSIDGGI